ncbi:DNA-binding transcriptional regulator PaaX [Hymenobacter sp. UYAg731]
MNLKSPENLSRFVQLFTLNDTEATQRVSEQLALVLRDPAAYQNQFADELEERGVVAALPVQELRDLALIDALLGEELLWESDWKDPAADLVYGINETLTQQKRTVRLAEPASGRATVAGPEALDIVQDLAEPVGLAVVLFTLDSDSYALSVVADAQAEEARQLAQELGFGITVY